MWEIGINSDEVLNATVLELERNQVKLANPGPKDDVEVEQ